MSHIGDNMNTLKLGIIGKGFVGSAVANGFNTEYVEQFVVDPKYTTNTIEQLVKETMTSIVFICLPTPQQDSHLDVDVYTVRLVLDELVKLEYKGIVVIKSTITPDHLTKMKKDFPLKLVYNPEFLTEANSLQDFIDPNMQVLGGKWKDCDVVEKAYNRHSKVRTVPTFKTDLITASLIKYTINSWLATKVTFFNEIAQLFQASGSNGSWDQFTDMITRDPRIGDSHMQVPGPDGKLGFGGHCFPKDIAGLIYYAKGKTVNLEILNKVLKVNEKIRNK